MDEALIWERRLYLEEERANRAEDAFTALRDAAREYLDVLNDSNPQHHIAAREKLKALLKES